MPFWWHWHGRGAGLNVLIAMLELFVAGHSGGVYAGGGSVPVVKNVSARFNYSVSVN